jgi:phosphoglycerate-specific signal transduction histidine kinase
MFHAEDVVFDEPYQNVVTRNTIQSIPKSIKNEMIELMAKTKDQVTQLYNQQRDELDGMKQDLQQRKDTVHRLETLVAKEHDFHQQFKQESEELSTLIKHLALEIKLQEDRKCVVCFQNKVEVAMVPCYHFGKGLIEHAISYKNKPIV